MSSRAPGPRTCRSSSARSPRRLSSSTFAPRPATPTFRRTSATRACPSSLPCGPQSAIVASRPAARPRGGAPSVAAISRSACSTCSTQSTVNRSGGTRPASVPGTRGGRPLSASGDLTGGASPTQRRASRRSTACCSLATVTLEPCSTWCRTGCQATRRSYRRASNRRTRTRHAATFTWCAPSLSLQGGVLIADNASVRQDFTL